VLAVTDERRKKMQLLVLVLVLVLAGGLQEAMGYDMVFEIGVRRLDW
jgi:hypothetical protein